MKGMSAFVLTLLFVCCFAEKQCSPYHYDEQILENVELLELILKRMEQKLDRRDTSVKVDTQWPDNCPDNWLKIGKSCYLFVENNYSFLDARSNCQRIGADLVHINDRTENEFLRRHLKLSRANSYWIGLEDTANEGVFKWVDDNTTPTFTDWYIGQPDNSGDGEHCALFRSNFDYNWNDGTCHSKLGSICEIKANVKM